MSILNEKISSLRELVDGLNLKDVQDQNKIISGLVDALDVFAQEIERIDNFQIRMQEQVNTIDEDLGELEDEVYEDEFEDDLIEISCPHCEEIISFSENEINENDEVECPVCHKTFEVEWECDCECDCDCSNDKE